MRLIYTMTTVEEVGKIKNHAVWILAIVTIILYLYKVTDYHYYYYYYSTNIAAILGRVGVSRVHQHNITITSITILQLCYYRCDAHIFRILTQQATNLYSPIFVKSSL